MHPSPSRLRRNPSPPYLSRWEKVVAFAQVLTHTAILKAIQDQVRLARARFGQYDLIDFVAVLTGYILSGEPTLLAFYERLALWADAFMALFGRNRLPHRSTLSRFLAALDQPTVEALRTRFQEDAPARNPFLLSGGLVDRIGRQWLVIDVDGTWQAARQRALPQTYVLPAPHRRFEAVCAPGYQGRKRGEVVRTRTKKPSVKPCLQSQPATHMDGFATVGIFLLKKELHCPIFMKSAVGLSVRFCQKIRWTIEREMFAKIALTGTVDEKLLTIGICSSRTCNNEYIPIGVGKISSLISPVAHSKRT